MAVRNGARVARRHVRRSGVGFERTLAKLGAHSVDELALVHVIETHVGRVLNAVGRSRTMAAAFLGVHRRSLQRMLARGIHAIPAVGGARPRPETGLSARLKEISMKEHSLEERIEAVVKETAEVIMDMVRANLSEEVQRALGKRSDTGRGRAVRQSGNGHRAPARRVPTHCIVPECDRRHKGPRFSFVCDEHVGLSKTEKRKHLEAWKAENTAPKNGLVGLIRFRGHQMRGQNGVQADGAVEEAEAPA